MMAHPRRCGKRATAAPPSRATLAANGGRGRPPSIGGATLKIYTRTGDDGSTGVLGAGRLSKADARIEAYGTVDELNAALGVARTLDTGRALADVLELEQRRLFLVGAELACTDPAALARLLRVTDEDVARMETTIDRMDQELPKLARFIVPGGTPLAAQLHAARTICRRAERRVVAASASAPIEPRLVRYLNRLADLLFVMARWANAKGGIGDAEWRPEGGTSS